MGWTYINFFSKFTHVKWHHDQVETIHISCALHHAARQGAKTINVFRACLGAQLTICAQQWRNFVLFSMVSFRFVLSRVCVFLYSLGPRTLMAQTEKRIQAFRWNSRGNCYASLTWNTGPVDMCGARSRALWVTGNFFPPFSSNGSLHGLATAHGTTAYVKLLRRLIAEQHRWRS